MLQPQRRAPVDPILKARIVWVALVTSLILYAIMLFQLGKITFVAVPEVLTDLEKLALTANLVVLASLVIRKKAAEITSLDKKTALWIVSWALNEMPAVFAFVVVFQNGNGNGFLFVLNFCVAILANVLTFPKKD